MPFKRNSMSNTEDIWNKYNSNLLAFVKSRVGGKEIAEDILQEAFIKVHEKINTLKDSAKLESWLYQITRNSIVDYYRAKDPKQELPSWVAGSEIEGENIIRRELSGCLASMINELPEKYRLAVQMSEIDGRTQKEVAEKESISLSGAKSRIQRGRNLLKAMLHGCCEIEINSKNQMVSYEKKKNGCGEC